MMDIKYSQLDKSYPKTFKGMKEMFGSHEKCFVAFEKKDKTIREMLCTTCISMMPEDKRPKSVLEPVVPVEYDADEPDPTYYRVFDLELGEWRSFTIESLIVWGGV
jgi:hypothetical protein